MFKIQWPVKKTEPEINVADFVHITWTMDERKEIISVDEVGKVLGNKITFIDNIPCFNKIVLEQLTEDFHCVKSYFRKELGIKEIQFYSLVDEYLVEIKRISF